VPVQQHVYKEKVFRYFEQSRAHMHSKLRKNANKSKKKFFFKNSGWVSNNAGFHADFKSVEKFLKKCTKKSY
jgi:hypothetical protein